MSERRDMEERERARGTEGYFYSNRPNQTIDSFSRRSITDQVANGAFKMEPGTYQILVHLAIEVLQTNSYCSVLLSLKLKMAHL